MSKKVITLIVIIGLLVIGYFSLEFFVKEKIRSFLSEQENSYNLSYNNLQVSLIQGNASLNSTHFRTTSEEVEAKRIAVIGLNVFSLIFGNEISIKQLEIDHPQIKLYQTEDSDEASKKGAQDSFDKTIVIKNVVLKNGQLVQSNGKVTILKLDDFDIRLNHIKIDKNTLKEKIPFRYKSYNLKGEDFSYLMSTLQTLKIEDFEIQTDKAQFHSVKVSPNYSLKKYVDVIPYENDLMNIDFDSVQIIDYNLSLKESGKFTAAKLQISDVDANIYRDKRVKDDPNEKKIIQSNVSGIIT